jgi:uncharacterized Ntn-hydrolase superfamily protein
MRPRVALSGVAIFGTALIASLAVALSQPSSTSAPQHPSTQSSTPAPQHPSTEVNGPFDPPSTFSILGFDPRTGELGGAVHSAVFSVGNGVLWAEAGVGIAATQAIVDVSYGPQALELLRKGMAPKEIITTIWDRDPDPRPGNWTKHGRQFAVMNPKGEMAAYTGPKASAWAGDRQGKFVTAQGNILAGEKVVTEMVRAFEESEKDEKGNPVHISFRLMAALDAGQAAGGDTRGMQSAAMIVVKKGCGVWVNNDVVLRLQVDDMPVPALKPGQTRPAVEPPSPLKEMRRLVDRAASQRRGRAGCF